MKQIRLSKQLALEQKTTQPDGAGGITTTWRPVGTLWAEIKSGTGRESGGVEVILSLTPYRVTVRAAPPSSNRRPKPGQRFRDGARFLYITAVAEKDPNGFYLTCFAREEEPV